MGTGTEPLHCGICGWVNTGDVGLIYHLQQVHTVSEGLEFMARISPWYLRPFWRLYARSYRGIMRRR